MDIRSLLDKPTDVERRAIDAVLGEPASAWQGGVYSNRDGRVAFGGQSARAQRHLLLPALHAAQDAVGAVSRGALGYISDRLTVPPAEVYGVATFYALFKTDLPGQAAVHLCDDIVCASKGSSDLGTALEADGVDWESSPCLGQCDRAPAVLTHSPGRGYANSAPASVDAAKTAVFEELPAGMVHQDRSELRLLDRVGHVEPTSLSAYRESKGYVALSRAVEIGSSGVIEELEKSGLRGRGGAAFPMGLKWRGLANAEGPEKYVIANGDESEPGTFKDRMLMEGDPFAVVEAMTIYGFATGASKGFIYVRAEYPTAESRLRAAIKQAYEAGLLGEDVAGAGFSFDLEVRRGAGAYICGEETALFASIEGYRGEPRQKPPFPTQSGVFGKPTGINNVETLLASLLVVRDGGGAFAEVGTAQSAGPKLFCVSGAVSRPGVFEVPFGTSLRDLLEMAAPDDVEAVLMGGAAGSFLDSDSLDVELSFEGVAAAGTTLGSGAVIVFGPDTDFMPLLQRIARFFSDESCGQCVPCRIGTVRQEEALLRIGVGSPLGSIQDELDRLVDVARVMTDASICGLGQTAASAIQSAFALQLAGTER